MNPQHPVLETGALPVRATPLQPLIYTIHTTYTIYAIADEGLSAIGRWQAIVWVV